MNRPLQYAAALAIGLSLTCPQAALAIAARHDRPEARYIQHASEAPAVGSVVGLLTGTLIAPEWVLTAAHGAELMVTMVPDPEKRQFEVNGKRYRIDATFVPDARVPLDWSKSGDLASRNAHDLALLRLTGPVVGVAPLPIEEGAVQPGADVTVIGAGTWSADGRTGVPLADAMKLPKGKVRAGTNRIDEVDTTRHVLKATFDDPSSAAATDLECGLGVGDSGGPLLVATRGGWAVAGVIAAYDMTGREAMGVYGDRIEATQVGAYADWIRHTMGTHVATATTIDSAAKVAKQATSGAQPAADVVWPKTVAGARARAYFDALNANSDAPMRAFVPVHWSPASLEEKSLDDRIAQQRAAHAQFGTLAPVEVRDGGEYAITVLADASGAPFRLAFTFELSPEAPHYSTKTRIGPAQQ